MLKPLHNILDHPNPSWIAKGLIETGYAIFPYEDTCAKTLLDTFQTFCTRNSPEDLQKWCFEVEKRPDGKFEPDDGYMARALEEGKDQKHVFHYRPSLRDLLLYTGVEPTDDDVHFLVTASEEYASHQSLALQILEAVSKQFDGTFDFTTELCRALSFPGFTSRALLRLLWYPEQMESDVRAKVHFDRCALSLHAGDSGGTLYVRQPDGSEEDISPPPGHMLAFWGEKGQLYAKEHGGVLDPIAHGSRAEIGQDRKAIVSFWHINRMLWDSTKVWY